MARFRSFVTWLRPFVTRFRSLARRIGATLFTRRSRTVDFRRGAFFVAHLRPRRSFLTRRVGGALFAFGRQRARAAFVRGRSVGTVVAVVPDGRWRTPLPAFRPLDARRLARTRGLVRVGGARRADGTGDPV